MAKVIDYYGDSTIWGYLQGGGQANPTPVATFAASLTTAETYTVNNKGVPGQGTRRLLGQGDQAYYGGVAPLDTLLQSSTATYCIFNHLLNDADPSQENNSTATYETNLRQIVSLVRSYGKIPIFETCNPTSNFTYTDHLATMRFVASDLNVPLIDQEQMLQDYMSANGFTVANICPDGEHPSQAIYDKKGQYSAGQFKTLTEGSNPVLIRPFLVGDDSDVGAMTFQDEFDGTSLNRDRWALDQIWWNQTPQMDNYAVQDGSLKIWPVSDFRNRDISTDGSFKQMFGFYEIEARLPYGKGPWPAFWLYQHIGDDRPEIDIMEAYSGGGVASGWSDANLHPINYGITLHEANADYSSHIIPYSSTLANAGYSADLFEGYHKYAVKWTATAITFYFDGLPIGTYTYSDDYFHKELFILLTLQIGSASGEGDSTTPLGVTNSFDIKYCRVWGLADGSHTVTTNLPTPSGTTSDGGVQPQTTNFGTYKVGDVLTIKYDGAKVEYRQNGNLLRTVAATTPNALFFDSSFKDPGGSLKSIRLTPLGSSNWEDITGVGKPEDNATLGATFDKNIFGRITASNATTYIANGAINNVLIGNIIESANFVAGQSGWQIDKNGNIELNDAIFRGSLGANTVTADNIISNSATNFERITRFAPNGTQTIPFVMDHFGYVMVVLSINWQFHLDDLNQGSYASSVGIDSDSGGTLTSSGFGRADSVMLYSLFCGQGNHTVYVSGTCNGNNGNHVFNVQLFKSYR